MFCTIVSLGSTFLIIQGSKNKKYFIIISHYELIKMIIKTKIITVKTKLKTDEDLEHLISGL